MPPWSNKQLIQYGESGPLIQNPFSQGIRGTDWDGSTYECSNCNCPSNTNMHTPDLSNKDRKELLISQKYCSNCSEVINNLVVRCPKCQKEWP